MQRPRSLRERAGAGSTQWCGPVLRTLAAAGILGLAGSCGGGGRDPNAADPTLASSRQAQEAFRAIHARWLALPDERRHELEARFDEFIRSHRSDPKADVARVYRAWLLAERGLPERARAVLADVRPAAGAARDFGAVVEAKLLLRSGEPELALRLLEPLAGKLIDPDERSLHGEERVMAALAARRHQDAIAFMLEWVADGRADIATAIRQRIERYLTQVPTTPLEAAMHALERDEKRFGADSSRAKQREWLLKVVRERLVRTALERSDTELARRLLASDARDIRRGERGNALMLLAARGTVAPRVLGRQVGLVLSTRNTTLSRRSAEVVMGVTRALGLPGSAAEEGAVGLVTADDAANEITAALEQLAGEGATVLLAGLDEKDATQALKYGARVGIPVIVLTRVGDAALGNAGFEVASDPVAEREVLMSALTARQVEPIVTVGPGGVRCESDAAAGSSRFPVLEWKRQRVHGLVLLGDEACAREVLRETRTAGLDVTVALGLEAGVLSSETLRVRGVIAARAGSLPLVPAASPPASLRAHVAAAGRPPSWYTALGHDAALLGRVAVQELPSLETDAPDAVAAHHRKVLDRLKRVEAPLWTSDTKGFSGGNRLRRKLGVLDVEAGKP